VVGRSVRKESENSEPMAEKELSDAIKEYKKHAERLIRNAAQFDFPGDYTN